MYKTYRILFILLAYIALILPNAHAQAKAQGPLKAIPAFLEANARDRDVIFNTANYNHNAKVYYLFNASEYYLNERTKFLTNISRLIFKNGADLIIHVEFSDSDKSMAKQYGKNYDTPKAARSCNVKCPIVNSYRKVTKRALFKDENGKRLSYVPSGLRAVDADGMPLAYFYEDDDVIIMRDVTTRKNTTLLKGKIDTKTWQAKAIELSYKQLVEKVTQRDAQASTNATGPVTNGDEDVEQQKKKAKKKQKPTHKTFKRVKKANEDEEGDDDDWDE